MAIGRWVVGTAVTAGACGCALYPAPPGSPGLAALLHPTRAGWRAPSGCRLAAGGAVAARQIAPDNAPRRVLTRRVHASQASPPRRAGVQQKARLPTVSFESFSLSSIRPRSRQASAHCRAAASSYDQAHRQVAVEASPYVQFPSHLFPRLLPARLPRALSLSALPASPPPLVCRRAS